MTGSPVPHAAGPPEMDDLRSALLVASYEYADSELQQLPAAARDADDLAAVLSDPRVGGFDVVTVMNQPAHLINLAVEEFFADRSPNHLLLCHISCHGVKDDSGDLYFAASDTRLTRLGATAVASDFVHRQMSKSRSRRVILLLDCCYAGAIEKGLQAKGGAELDLKDRFGGRGRAIITSSTATQVSFVDNRLSNPGEVQPSVFTKALVEGLSTGDADSNLDGLIGLDELYDYVYDKVRVATPNQTPSKWALGIQGELYVARRGRPVSTPTPLPTELEQAMESPLAGVRLGAVHELSKLLKGRHPGIALAARLALQRMTDDDSHLVVAAAEAALEDVPGDERAGDEGDGEREPGPAGPRLEVSTTVVDLGEIPLDGTPPEQRVTASNAGGGNLNPRVTTQDRWIRVSQSAEEVIVSVDPAVVGKHRGSIKVDSDGGSAAIEVRVVVRAADQSTGGRERGGKRLRLSLNRRLAAALAAGISAAALAGAVILLVVDALTDDVMTDDVVTALPDSTIVVPVFSKGEGSQLVAYDVHTGMQGRTIVESEIDFELQDPVISPDRKSIVYLKWETDGYRKRPIAIRPDGAPDKNLQNSIPCATYSRRPSWSNDGRRIAWLCTGENNVPRAFYVVDADSRSTAHLMGRGASSITSAPTWQLTPGRSAEQIVLSRASQDCLTEDNDVFACPSNLEAIDPDNPPGQPDPVTVRANVRDEYPDFAKGRGVVFQRSNLGEKWGDIWLKPPSGSVRNLTTGTLEGRTRLPTWSPDGEQIAFQLLADDDTVSLQIMTRSGSLVDPPPDLRGGEPLAPAWGSR